MTCFIFYAYWEKSQKSQLEKMIRMALAAVILVLAAVLLKTGYLLSQVGITAMLYLSILFILNFKISRLSMIVVSVLTIFEFGYNASSSSA